MEDFLSAQHARTPGESERSARKGVSDSLVSMQMEKKTKGAPDSKLRRRSVEAHGQITRRGAQPDPDRSQAVSWKAHRSYRLAGSVT